MTDEQVQRGFTEVYNNFWNRYKRRQPDKDSFEWYKIREQSVALQKEFPFLKETIIDMELEFDQRMRGRGHGK